MKPTIRCSELDRRLLCPGSGTLEPLVSKPPTGQEASDGTQIHDEIATTLLAVAAASMKGSTADDVLFLGDSKLNFNLKWIVDYCVREVHDRVPPDWSLLTEEAYAYEFERFILSGHIDCLALSPDGTEAIGFDWKTGYIPVDAAEYNEQVLGYICLIRRAYPKLDKVTFHIVQPRNDEDEGFERVSKLVAVVNPFSDDEYDLDRITESLERRVNHALENSLVLNSGRTQCRWCPVGIQCPVKQLELQQMKLTLTPEMIAKVKAEPDDALLGDVVITARSLEKPIEDATGLLKERIIKNGFVDAGVGTRITIKQENGSYKVPDKPKFFRELRTLIPNEDQLANALSFSMTSAKEGIATAMNIPKSGKKAPVTAEGVFDAKLRPLVEQGVRLKFVFSQ